MDAALLLSRNKKKAVLILSRNKNEERKKERKKENFALQLVGEETFSSTGETSNMNPLSIALTEENNYLR